MPFRSPPPAACWQHREARAGFEVACFQVDDGGCRIDGTTAAIEGGQAWVVTYRIELDARWVTRSARVTARSAAGEAETLLESDGAGRWRIDRVAAPHLDGCLDADLESSAMTNALPVHRLGLPPGGQADAPAAYVRAPGLAAELLEQTYTRIAGPASHQRYDYAAPAFGFRCHLVYDESGLVLDYPGIAVRAG